MKKAFSSSVLLALVSLGASSALADLACPEFTPKPFSRIETRIDAGEGRVIEAKNIDCSKVEFAANMIADIREMLSPELSTPGQLTFRMVDEFDNAFFNPEDISLNVPFQFVLEGYSKHPTHTIPIWAHEYGHAILDHNLVDAMPAWVNKMTEATGSRDHAEGIVQTVLGGYHEYFADVVAVLYTGKGDSVARSLYLTGFMANPEGKPTLCPANKPECRGEDKSEETKLSLSVPRDFTDRRNQLENWNPKYIRGPHNIFAPARYDIWKYTLSNPLYNGKEDKIVGLIVDAIIGDVSRRLTRMINADGFVTNESLKRELGDPRRVNVEFIDLLDQYFAKGLR